MLLYRSHQPLWKIHGIAWINFYCFTIDESNQVNISREIMPCQGHFLKLLLGRGCYNLRHSHKKWHNLEIWSVKRFFRISENMLKAFQWSVVSAKQNTETGQATIVLQLIIPYGNDWKEIMKQIVKWNVCICENIVLTKNQLGAYKYIPWNFMSILWENNVFWPLVFSN